MMKPLVLLMALGIQDDVDSLLEQLRSEKVEERADAEEKLVRLGKKAEPALVRAAASKDTELAGRAKGALTRMTALAKEQALEEKIRALPRTFKEVRYRLILRGKDAGGGLLKTTLEKDRIVLEDSLDAETEGKSISLKSRQTFRANPLLSPERVAVEAAGDEITSCVGEMRGEDFHVESNGQTSHFPLQPSTLTWFSRLRMLGVLPQEKGGVFEFDDLDELSGLRYNRGRHRLTCVGEEELVRDGRILKTWKWQETGRTIGEHLYWVREGRIARALIDKTKDWVFEVTPP